MAEESATVPAAMPGTRRRIATADERLMERANISSRDMHQAVLFIDAALALDEAKDQPPGSAVARVALEITAIIYYARPFTWNERRKKTRRAPPKGAPRLGKINLGPLRRPA